MRVKEEVFCGNVKLPAGKEPAKFGEGLKDVGKRIVSGVTYLCSDKDAESCSILSDIGCRPKTAECRFARLIEPKHQGHLDIEPKIVQGVRCLGEDLCTLGKCGPQPRFAQDYD